jgi:hypothetical protein
MLGMKRRLWSKLEKRRGLLGEYSQKATDRWASDRIARVHPYVAFIGMKLMIVGNTLRRRM